MNIIESYIAKNPYFVHPTIKVQKLVLHSVGCPQPSAAVFARAWNNPEYYSSSVHAVIDANTGDIYQCLPWNRRGEHCGGAANDYSIGVEMCESDAIQYTGGAGFTVSDYRRAQQHAVTAYESAVELFAYLCKQFGLSPSDILSHYEAGMIGQASGHVDPEHYWRGLKLSYTMNTFREDVRKAMSTPQATQKEESAGSIYRVQIGAFTVKGNAEAALEKARTAGFADAFIVEAKQTEPVKPISKKNNEEIAREVILGLWSNGDERKRMLASAGYDFDAIQSIVNSML